MTCRKQSLTKAKRITGFLLLNFSNDFIIDISVSPCIIYNYNIYMAFPSGADIAKEMKDKEQSMLKKNRTYQRIQHYYQVICKDCHVFIVM